jgi:tetratricopeptide (TPR) repeat protein
VNQPVTPPGAELNKWLEIEALLNEALSVPLSERESFLAGIGDANVRDEVASLLAADSAGSAPDLDAILRNAASILIVKPCAGTQAGHFSVLRELGRGGMGVVYLAKDLKLGREVALKLLPAGTYPDEAHRRRFEREARVAAALNHPNIVTIFEVGEWEGRPFIATELVRGETLAARIARGPLSEEESVRIGVQILAALRAAHGAGIVHRDLKPANAMVRVDGTVKVLDFGLARLMRNATSAGTVADASVPGKAMGTPGYAAPEQWEGKPADVRSDIYSFGCILYEMLSGARPALHGPPLRSPRLAAVVNRCLEPDPERRWRSAADLENELTRPASARTLLAPAGIAAAGAVLLLGAIFAWHSHAPARTLTDKDILVLADFNNKTGDPVFDGTLRQAVAIHLEQSPFLKIMDDAQIGQDLRLMRRSPAEPITGQLAHDICVREGAAATIEGSIASLGKTYVITMQAVACRDGVTMAREQRLASGKEHVLEAVGNAATAMRARLGESMASLQKLNRPLEQFTTSSLEALQNYSIGFPLVVQGRFLSAIPYFRRAIALDPNFAWAYEMLSIAYNNAGDRERVKQYATRAFALSGRASEFERLWIEARYYWQVTGETEKALDAYETAARAFPRDWSAQSESSFVLRDLGEFEKAVAKGEEAVALGPKMEPANRNLISAYASLDRFNEAKDACAKARAQQLDGALLHFRCLEVEYAAGDRDAIDRDVRWFFDKPEEYLGLGVQAVDADVHGNRSRAEEFYRRAAEAALRRGLKDAAADFDEADALAGALTGNCATSRRLGRPALALALCGNSAAAERLVEKKAKALPNGTIWNAVQMPAIQAAVQLRKNRPAAAIQLLAGATPYERAFPEVGWLRGQAYLSMGMGSDAVTEFKKILNRKGASWELFYPLSYAGLANAYALEGDSDASKLACNQLLALWSKADPGLPLLRRVREECSGLK